MEDTKKVPVIGVVQVLAMLKDGKTREEIRVHYGISKTDLGLLFKHKDLIGKKTIKPKAPSFTIVEDENPVDAQTDIEVVEEVVEAPKATMEIVEDASEPIAEGDNAEGSTEETVADDTVEEAEEEAKSTWT